jgi:predicted amidohydrolase
MEQCVQTEVWHEIKKGFRNLKNGFDQPNIIILPELTVPLCYERDLIKLSKHIGAVVVAGLDFIDDGQNIANRAIIIVPHNWPEKTRSKGASIYYFGKTFFSKQELSFFAGLNPPRTPLSDPTLYTFDAGPFGKIGVAICSDFFDIERFVIYRGKIHHMIVLSHNKDTSSYYFLAEAISRLVYCNVVICNTGFYGDSLAFSPYKDNHKRIIYRHEGQGLFTTQVVSLPVLNLDSAQNGYDDLGIFKSLPPAYKRSRPEIEQLEINL